MSWHTVEIRRGFLKVMNDDDEIGELRETPNGWVVDLKRPHAVASFKAYTSCLAFIQGVASMVPTSLPVTVKGGDYTYDGWIVARFPKRKSGQIRYVVEDENGRLFIHNGKQIGAE